MQVLTSKQVLTKWSSPGGRLGPQRLAALRNAPFGNASEEAAYASFLAAFATSSRTPDQPAATPVAQTAAAPADNARAVQTAVQPIADADGLRQRHAHRPVVDNAPGTEATLCDAPPHSEALPAPPPLDVLRETVAGLLREVGSPTGPRAIVAFAFIFVVAFFFPMALGVLGRLLALIGLL